MIRTKGKGRPAIYTDDMRAVLHAKGKSKLQEKSERRAIVDLLVSRGGIMSLKDIDAHFGYDIRRTVIALQKAGWVDIK